MIIAVKIILLLTLGTIAYQDIKDHLVWWFLFPLFALCGAMLFYSSTYPNVFLTMVGINLLLLLAYLGLLYLMLRFIIKKYSFSQAIGLGDVLMFVGLAVSFPSVTFMVFLFFSAILSFILGKVVNRNSEEKEIPYAGFTSLFLIGINLTHWLGLYKNLYVL